MPNGLHHVTAITARVQANVDFYAGFLGLRLVKRTAGLADEEQLHLFYGDAAGSPGSIVSFLVWEAGGRGRTSQGQASEIAFAVPVSSIGDWIARALAAQVPAEGPSREFGEPVLRLKDPDGLIVKLVGASMLAATPLPDPIAPTRLRSVTFLSADVAASVAFMEHFGYRPGPVEDGVRRLVSDTDAIDIRDASGFVPAVPGAGMIDHVAFRAADAESIRRMRLDLHKTRSPDDSATTVHDRRYFLSLYVRDPAGLLIEHATDGPGFDVDEPAETLGTELVIPIDDPARARDLQVMLPQFAMPGEERLPARDLPFIHRFHKPDSPDGTVIFLLHGTGGTEVDLMPLAHRIAPHATLLGIRGRATEEGFNRWFRRYDAVTFDQKDIRAEAQAFAAFVEGAIQGYGLDPRKILFLGYSNGANLLAAVMLLHPQTVRRAVLLRAISVLEQPPAAALAGTQALLVTGAEDPLAPLAGPLEDSLTANGAQIEARTIKAGHALTDADLAAVREWLTRAT
ncbi:MAG: VOC family protein [Salinarimonas sp.]|nr:VOC family protein [Salinarimonas sp.]